MKSEGNSTASIQLITTTGIGCETQDGQKIITEMLVATRDWFRPDGNDTYRYRSPVFVAPSDMEVYAYLQANGPTGTRAWFDAVKLEESTVATPWSPGTVGASIVDAGGVQIDGTRGGLFRYRGRGGGKNDLVEGGAQGLVFGTVEIGGSSSDGALDVSSKVGGQGAVIRVLGNQSTEAIEFYDQGVSRGSLYTNEARRLVSDFIMQPAAAAATGVQTSSHDENGNPKWGKIAHGRVEGQWRWGGVTAICRTRYGVDLVTLHIMSDPVPPEQPIVDLNVKRLQKRSAGNRYCVGVSPNGAGYDWQLWGTADQAYDGMVSYVLAVHVSGGWCLPVTPDTIEYSADPPRGYVYGAMYEQFTGVATP
jgi:hypothetical protein